MSIDIGNLMDSPEIRWTKEIGEHLIEKVSITIGGDVEPRWYCASCEHFKSDIEPAPGTICNQTVKEFSYDLFRTAWKEDRGDDLTDDNIDDLSEEFQDIVDRYTVYTSYTCPGREFYREKREGMVLDTMNGEYIKMWQKFSIPRCEDSDEEC